MVYNWAHKYMSCVSNLFNRRDLSESFFVSSVFIFRFMCLLLPNANSIRSIMTSCHSDISHSVLIIRNFTIVKLFVHHWLRSSKCNRVIPHCVQINTKFNQHKLFALPFENKTHSQAHRFKEINGFRPAPNHATGLRATTKYSLAYFNVEKKADKIRI